MELDHHVDERESDCIIFLVVVDSDLVFLDPVDQVGVTAYHTGDTRCEAILGSGAKGDVRKFHTV